MITKRPTIEDIYNHDYFMASPGVREGLLERSKSGDPEFTTEMTDDGEVVYYNAPHGESVPVGRNQFQPPQQQEGDILLAEVGSRGLPERAYTGVNPDSMKQIDPTIRQRVADFMQAGFEGMGVDRATARKNAQTLMGGQSSGLPLGMGIADIIPFLGTGLQTEEAVIGGKSAMENASQGNYGAAAVEGVGSAIGMIPGIAGTAKAGKAIAKKAEGMFKKVSPKDIPSLFSHGTSEAGADAIMQSGKFDPSAGERKYSYSQFGRQAAYLTPEKGWWLDAERASSGRAVTYDAAVDAKIDPKANIVRIDSPEELHQLAKKAGFADAYDMMKSLDVESIEYAKDADMAKTSSLQEFTAYIKENNADFPDNPDYIKEHYEEMKNLASYFDEADNATKQLIDSGIDGIYISDEFSANLSPETYKNWYPAGDQLAMFRPELVKPLAKKLLKKESAEAK